ncbi:hypothetical protein sce1121 [Sorangium cellulosum So ce56]|uniref:N-acetyltransferase domain-containing protein n=1 Tax=Sorangium cellulosum (strain So ce56) TaxID=448385 RepID=A9F0K1_SORC5|nr:GNAT family protein [Sorangium cellulosum]CAN91278.1 hypothetical protein sce1121 [Sorangium cellulosum So ce56]
MSAALRAAAGPRFDVGLEPLGFEHAAAMQELLAGPAVAGPLRLPHPLPPRHVEREVVALRHHEREGTRASFAIVVARWVAQAAGQAAAPGGAPVVAGGCDLCAIDRHGRTAEIRYWLGEPFWGRGIGRAAVSALLGEARARGLGSVTTFIAPGNLRSRRLAEALGFERMSRSDAEEAPGGAPPLLAYGRAL